MSIKPTRIAVVLLLALVLWPGTVSAAPTFTLAHVFAGGTSSQDSYGPLIADPAGNLYGASSAGGNGGCMTYTTTGCGTVFELKRPTNPEKPWTETVLYRFPGGNGPWFPFAGLARDASGNLYGVTTDGGPYLCAGLYCGSVFELSPPAKLGGPWKESVVFRFSNPYSGSTATAYAPASGVTLDGKGNLYGTTALGGPLSKGEVYRLTRPATGHGSWTETVLSGFESGGSYPDGGVTFDSTGDLFGTTYFDHGQVTGLVFELTPRSHGYWKETVIYQFGSNTCGPKTNLVFDQSGNLYGTAQGCPALPGAIYRLTPPQKRGGSWTESVLKSFDDGTNFGPGTTLALDSAGNIYATTAGGGTHSEGTVFELASPTWSETILHSFDGTDGDFPTSGPILGPDGALYGAVLNGGSRHGICKMVGCGTVYRLVP